jgi:hypothetical protein
VGTPGQRLQSLGEARELRCNIAEVLLAQGRASEAVRELQAVLDALRNVDHEATRMRVHSALHRAHKALGEFEPALAHCEAQHQLELQRLALQNQAQGRLMVNRVEVEHQLALADRAHLEAEVQRLRAIELEAEKRLLETHSDTLQRMTLEDPLTGLADRHGAERELPALFHSACAAEQPLALAVIDARAADGDARHTLARADAALDVARRAAGDRIVVAVE